MVERWWGRRGVYAQDFASLVRPSSGGILTTDLESATRERGWDTRVFRGTPELVQQSLRDGVPVVALMEVARDRYHYVVLIGWGDGQVVFHDPATAPFTATDENAFLARWAGANWWALVVRPGPIASAKTRADTRLRARSALRCHVLHGLTGHSTQWPPTNSMTPPSFSQGGPGVPLGTLGPARNGRCPLQARASRGGRPTYLRVSGTRSRRRIWLAAPRDQPVSGRRSGRRPRGMEQGRQADCRPRPNRWSAKGPVPGDCRRDVFTPRNAANPLPDGSRPAPSVRCAGASPRKGGLSACSGGHRRGPGNGRRTAHAGTCLAVGCGRSDPRRRSTGGGPRGRESDRRRRALDRRVAMGAGPTPWRPAARHACESRTPGRPRHRGSLGAVPLRTRYRQHHDLRGDPSIGRRRIWRLDHRRLAYLGNASVRAMVREPTFPVGLHRRRTSRSRQPGS